MGSNDGHWFPPMRLAEHRFWIGHHPADVHNAIALASIRASHSTIRSTAGNGDAKPGSLRTDRAGRLVTETVAEIVAAHRAVWLRRLKRSRGLLRGSAIITTRRFLITLRDEKQALAEAPALAANDAAALPLYGVPVAV